MNVFADMCREVGGLIAHQAEKLEIKAGSISRLCREISRNVDLIPTDGKKVASAEFMGVRVVEDVRMPENMVAIVSNGELVQVIKFSEDA